MTEQEAPKPGTLAYAQVRAEADGPLNNEEDGYDGPFPRVVVAAPSDTDAEPLTNEALWDFADDLLELWNIEDLNPPSLTEQFRDRFVARFGAVQPVQVEVTESEWRAAMDAERARQIEKGYDDEHDRRHGVAHLLSWAIDYARRGKSVESATMIRQALEMLNRTEVAPAERSRVVVAAPSDTDREALSGLIGAPHRNLLLSAEHAHTLADAILAAGFSRSQPVQVEATEAEVVTLCGSTKFKDAINAENMRLTMEGNLVISLGVFGHTDLPDYDWTTDASDLKRMLDALHRQKIDLADRVHVVNVGGYYGESTAREIEYARSLGKPVTFMVAPGVPVTESGAAALGGGDHAE